MRDKVLSLKRHLHGDGMRGCLQHLSRKQTVSHSFVTRSPGNLFVSISGSLTWKKKAKSFGYFNVNTLIKRERKAHLEREIRKSFFAPSLGNRLKERRRPSGFPHETTTKKNQWLKIRFSFLFSFSPPRGSMYN